MVCRVVYRFPELVLHAARAGTACQMLNVELNR